MGQANNRGNKAERIAQAIQRDGHDKRNDPPKTSNRAATRDILHKYGLDDFSVSMGILSSLMMASKKRYK